MQAKDRTLLLAIVGLALVVALVASHALAWAFMQLGLQDVRLFGVAELSTTRLLGLVVGAGLAAVVVWVEPMRTSGREVIDELYRVSWPARDETGHATVVVVITVVVCSVFLGAFDAIWMWLTSLLMGTPTAGR